MTNGGSMKRFIAATAVFTVLLFTAEPRLSAQQANQGNQAQLIQTLMTRIEQLEKRVSELEASKPTPVAATPQAPPQIEASDLIHGETMPAATEGPNLKIAGFSDFNFGASDAAGSRSGFTEGQFILHLNSNLSPKVSFMGEISLSARTDAGIGSQTATGFK